MLYDAPSLLLWAAVQLLESAPIAHVRWYEEPGEYRWRLERTGASVAIRVWLFNDWLTAQGSNEEHAALVFASDCSILRFARQVRAATQAVLDRYGREEYQRRWGWEFPNQAHQTLGELIGSTRVTPSPYKGGLRSLIRHLDL